MLEYLVFNQQMPQQPAQQPGQPQQPAPGAAPAQPAVAPQPGAAPAQPAQPAAAPQPGQPAQPGAAAPSEPVGMGAMAQWAAIGGAASGAIQAVLSIVGGFDIVGMLMTIGMAAVIGVLVGVLLGQFGAKIPFKATLMVKAALFMFVLNLVVGFVFGLGEGFLGLMLGIIGIGAGAFLYGFILEKKIPNLI